MFRRLIPVLGCLFTLGRLTVMAQAPNPAATLSQQANALFDQGRYPDATTLYQRVLTDFPNSEVAGDAQIHLAYCEFFTAAYDSAIERLRKVMATPATPPELQELCASLLPQVISQQAGTFPDRRHETEGGLRSGDQRVRRFYRQVPKKPGRGDVALRPGGGGLPDRALCRRRARLAADRRHLPRSENADDSAFLLALTLGSQANGLAADPAKAGGAIKAYEEARALLADVINKKADLALANDALYQLGATLLAQSAASPEAARAALLTQALGAYRGVQPREPMLAAQNSRISRLRDQRLTEARKGSGADRGLLRQFESRLARETAKLASLQGKADPVLTARLQCGAVFYQQNRYDETRVLMGTLAPVATAPDDEKTVLYFTALSYAGQANIDKAVAGYEKFQAKYAGDPIAENLPLVIGSMFMSAAKPNAERANKYFAEFTQLYPNSNLRDVAVLQQASTSAALKRFDEALATIDNFFKTSPKRPLAAAAELTRARVIKDKGDLPAAIVLYKKVRDTFTDRPEAEEAAFFVGFVELQNRNVSGALAELKAFLGKYPSGKLAPSALLTQAQAQAASNAKDAALASLAEVVSRFPKSPEAGAAYFQRANIFIGDKKFDEVIKTLTEFVEKYPDDPQAFAASDRIAAIQLQQNQPDDAAATYGRFAARQPKSPAAPEALGKIAALWERAARGLGSYIVLGAPQRDVWARNIDNSVKASERQLEAYPDAPATALGLQTLLSCQRLLMDAKARTFEQVRDYFQALAKKYDGKPAAKSRIIFRLAALTMEKDPATGLADMQGAYDPAVVYSPADLDQFGGLLLASDPGAAAKVFQKLADDYPNPPGMSPAQAPQDVQDAQATALFGQGTLAEKKGDAAAAAQAFEALKKSYPRSAKAPQANLGIAESLFKQGKPDLATPLLAEVAKAPSAPLETRARGMMLMAKIQQDKGQVGALDTYLKVQAFYPTATQAPEGLWTGAQLLEKQAASLPDVAATPNTPTKSTQMARARKAYETIVNKYPESAWAAQARTKLASVGKP